MKRSLLLIVCCLSFSFYLHAQHTFSIVAVDPATGEVGSAGATCLSSSDCGGCGGAIIISGILPGRGACNAQATVCIPNNNLNNVLTHLGNGNSPAQALDQILTFDNCIFGDTSTRQYGIVDLDSMGNARAVGFSGSGTTSYSNHLVGPNYSIQGNILLGPQILDSMEAGFLNTNGDLCEKLMAALQGANVPGADTRCLSDSVSSKSAFIRVARPGDDPQNLWLDLNIPEVAQGVEPIDTLAVVFQTWKLNQGVDDPDRKIPFDLYPNPTSGQVHLRFHLAPKAGTQIHIYDVMGAELATYDVDAGVFDMDLDLLALGHPGKVFFFVLRDADGAQASRKVLLN